MNLWRRILVWFFIAAPVMAAATALPWTQSLSAQDSDPTQATAQHHTESDLNWKIEEQRRTCVSQKGTFSKKVSADQCKLAAGIYTCTQTATVTCK